MSHTGHGNGFPAKSEISITLCCSSPSLLLLTVPLVQKEKEFPQKEQVLWLDFFCCIRWAVGRDPGAEPVFPLVGNRIGAHGRCADRIIGAVFRSKPWTQNVPEVQFTDGKGGQDLIHGQSRKMARNARKRKSTRGLDKVSEDQPQSATSELERRVIQLENDVAILKQLTRWSVFNKDAPTDEKKKPGVKEKIEDEDLFTYRDGLTLWLEAYWP
jgi:hypothetical protein